MTSLVLFAGTTPASAADGLTVVHSAHDVKTTADRLEKLLKDKGMAIFNRVDHAAGAGRVGLSLRPSELIIFGNPKSGTPFMQCGQSAGIDLPLKALIWRDEAGKVWLGYNDPKFPAKRHAIEKCGEVVEAMTQSLANFAKAATVP